MGATGATGAAATVTPYRSLAMTPFRSVSSTVNVEVPDWMGTPLIAPLEGVKVRPEGNDPMVTDQM
jgi:hypothetical protein